MQPALPMPDVTFTVSKITRYIKSLLQSDILLQDVWVQGEVSNFTRAASGHCYFTIKDESAALSCVMWRTDAERLLQLPRNNDAIEAHGAVTVYEARGQYQLTVNAIRPAGVGRLYLLFEELRNRLAAEGLFDEARKRPLPERPQRLGIVTSPTGAALQDILRTLRQRYPLVDVLLAPTQVQGDDAPPQIVAALAALNRWPEPVDAIILARGGGSLEDLWAFNDERVARAIAASRIPVICGVGHETDFTIADFVADVRAPTPTGAAAMAVPDGAQRRDEVWTLAERMAVMVEGTVAEARLRLDTETRALAQLSPQQQIAAARQRMDDLTHTARLTITHRQSLWRSQTQRLESQLVSLNPLQVLQRGYAVVRRQADGQLVRQVADVAVGDGIRVRVADGEFTGRVEGA